MKNNLFSTTIVFFCFLTNVYAENGHVDLKFLSENVSSLASTQNLSGFGIEIYKNFKTETDGENYESYIEKNSREKKLEKKLYREREEGANPKTIAKLENSLFVEREKRNKLIAKRNRLQADPNWGDSEGSKIGVGIILGLKYLDGYAETAVQNYSVQKNSLEIGLRISW
tara:strand:+ start:512 stop:1021 length:510 start_codon:yes stop_codon:yes gene_type:complete